MVKFVRLTFYERSEMKRLSRTNPALAGSWFRVPDTGKYRVQISEFEWTIFRAAEAGHGSGDPRQPGHFKRDSLSILETLNFSFEF
jgi:hypothetical protein